MRGIIDAVKRHLRLKLFIRISGSSCLIHASRTPPGNHRQVHRGGSMTASRIREFTSPRRQCFTLVAEKGYSPEFGARPLERLIEPADRPTLARQVLAVRPRERTIR